VKTPSVRIYPRSILLSLLGRDPTVAQKFMASLAREVMSLRTRTRHRESEKTGRSVGFQMSLESFLYASCVFGGWRNGDRVRVRISPGCQ
jgi:hypothetical protein